jgi:cell division protease FtsH
MVCDGMQVTNMARQMVINFGMSDIGPWSLMDPSAMSGDVIMRMMARNSMSENLQARIDTAVKKISIEAYEVALKQIRENREAIDRITEMLIEKETLTGMNGSDACNHCLLISYLCLMKLKPHRNDSWLLCLN